MADELTQEQMLKDIYARTAQLGNVETRIKQLEDALPNVMDDSGRARKFRFDARGASKLTGSKFARWGLGLADIEFLHDWQTALRGMPKPEGGVFSGPSEELGAAFKELSDAVYIPEADVRAMDRRALDDLWPRVPKMFRTPAEYNRVLAAIETRTSDSGAAGGMDSADSGYGSQLVGAQYVRDLWDGARGESRVLGLFQQVEMTDPVAYVPVAAAPPEMFYLSENTIRDPSEYTATKTGSNRVTLTAYKFGIYQIWSTEMEEDSLVPYVPFLRDQAQFSIAHYSDSLIINGDTTTGGAQLNTSSDPAGTGKHYLALDGLRHVGLVDNTGNQKDLAGAISLRALMAAKGRMVDSTYLHDWGHPVKPDDLVYIADPETADNVALLDEVAAWKQNQGVALLNGEMARILGHPLLASIAVPKSLATGYVHASTGNSYGTVVTLNRRGIKVGIRRRVSMRALFEPGTDQTKMLYSLRMAVGRYSPTGSASGIECADVIFDITI